MTADADGLNSRAQGRLGTVLRGKYRLDRVLGVGGMAVVYKATHRNQAEFAVKMLHPELSIHEDIRTRFLREGYAANSVKHPGAVLVSDDDVAEDGAAFLVMELLQGAGVESLWERSGHRLPVRAALSVADQLLDVLAAAHAKGIVHRDIKPANLFAAGDGTLKVLDFGIARVRDAAAAGHGGQATGTGMLLGTPAFMAPEQAFGKAREIDGQTDVWATGATLFTLLSGQFVHQGENASQLMVLAATEPARPVGSLVADVPPAVAQVIDRALAFEKGSRWPSAVAMREAIAKASLEAFGEKPSKTALAMLVEEEDIGLAKTQERPVVSVTADRGTAPAQLPPTVGMTVPAQPSSRSLLRFAGGTTAQPVSIGEFAPPTPHPASARRWMPAFAIVSVGAVVLVVGGLALRAALGSQRGAAAVMAVPSSSAVAPVITVTAASPPTIAPTSVGVVAVPDPNTASPTVATPSKPVATSRPKATVAPSASTPPVPAASSPPSTPAIPSAPPRPAANCNPNFTYDADGNKVFKPECFGH